ncbi:hypothetical protein GALL_289360 [mine drainage metagenome]|uniref:Uncharacterized protein n=1 Tax=mine drainage metagenome TaxID=410659 RepID=A0A1J5RHX1_9ZZZZ
MGARLVPIPVDDQGMNVAEGVRTAPDARAAPACAPETDCVLGPPDVAAGWMPMSCPSGMRETATWPDASSPLSEWAWGFGPERGMAGPMPAVACEEAGPGRAGRGAEADARRGGLGAWAAGADAGRA